LKEAGYFVGSYRKAFGPGSDHGKEVAGKKFDGLDTFLKERPKDQPFCFWFGASDPRVLGGGDAFDQYEYLGRLRRKVE
jgi:hypothetical protein